MTSRVMSNILLGGLLTLLVPGTTLHEIRSQRVFKLQKLVVPGSPATPVLEVINRHFTVGKRIPSVYLKVFSDRTAECHTLAYSGMEPEFARKTTLAPDEFERLTAVLDSPKLPIIKSRYQSTRMVIDSWMEWDVSIQRPGHVQKIEIVNFSTTWFGMAQPYPDALLQLGCSVWKIRDEVYGDEPAYHDRKCKEALEAH
jgi:hypothetical protein